MPIEKVATLVELAARHVPGKPNCLERSLALWWLLRRQGTDAHLRIGARRPTGAATPDFHAWIEHDGKVLNDRADIAEEFVVFDRPITPSTSQFG